MMSTIKPYVLAYAATAVIFLGLDFLWLSKMGPTFYRRILGDMALETFKLAPAILFYAIYVLGIVILAIAPAFDAGRWQVALWRGLILGLCAYATYDLTNQATLRNWSTSLTVVDLSWGACLTAVSATLGYLVSVKMTD
jgi:uncharacterized membrane protein